MGTVATVVVSPVAAEEWPKAKTKPASKKQSKKKVKKKENPMGSPFLQRGRGACPLWLA
jgi:hypothetical protein